MINESILCQSPQSAEVSDLTTDYIEFCKHLRESGNAEVVPLSEFAIWRDQELLDSYGWVNKIPTIN